jgi:hypothetical protein
MPQQNLPSLIVAHQHSTINLNFDNSQGRQYSDVSIRNDKSTNELMFVQASDINESAHNTTNNSSNR